MSDTFANEFAKWLERKTGQRNSDEIEDVESSDESYGHNEYNMNTADNDESKYGNKKCRDQVLDRQGNLLSVSVSDQAPILVNDDDDCHCLFQSEKQQFEDEPPVLEPAPRRLQDYKMSNLECPHFSSQKCKSNYVRNIQHGRSSLKKHKSMKTYSNQNKRQFVLETLHKPKHKYLLKSKDKESGNIFDMFNSHNYDHYPPPLIPSPEALLLHSELPKSGYKQHPSHSPNFCAMEADSTSEITGDRTGSFSYSRKLSKNSVHGEVAIECDSTCMLPASPMIVSPASVSNGENEEVRDSGGGKKYGDLHNSDSSSYKFDRFCSKPENEHQQAVMRESINLVCDTLSENTLTSDSCDRYYILQRTERLHSETCPELSIVNTDKYIQKSTSFNVSSETESNNICDFPNEPPVLSVISPSLRSHHRYRKKLYTIDSPDNCYRSDKIPHSVISLPADVEHMEFDMSTPPTLTHVSETVTTHCSKDKCCKVAKSQYLQHCENCLQDKNIHIRRRSQQRYNIFSYADLLENSKGFAEDLQSFVNSTSQLSQLQSRMHTLFYHLFPQLKDELDTMSPESIWFENLLSDIVMLLEQPSIQMKVQDNSSPQSLSMANSYCEKLVLNIPKLCYTSQSCISESSSFLSSGNCQAADIVKHISNYDATCSNILSASHYKQKSPCRLIGYKNVSWDHDNDLVTPHLSQMTLKNVEELVRPSKVLLLRNPGALLERFAELSCRTLQLLLPDLAVSLYKELAAYPHDLVIFIDNVIQTNSL